MRRSTLRVRPVAASVLFGLALAASPAGAVTPARKPLRLVCGTFDPLLDPAPALPGPAGRYYIVQHHRPVVAADAAAIGRLGGRVLAWLPDDALLARLGPAAAEALGAAPGIRWIGRLEPRCRIAPAAAERPAAALVVRLFAGEDPAPVERAIAAGLAAGAVGRPSIERLGALSPERGARLRLRRTDGFGSADLAFIAGLEAVEWVEPWSEPAPVNDHTIWLGQSDDTVALTNYAVSATIWNHGLLGTGQVAAALDTGLDSDSCFFKLDPAGAAQPQFLAPPAVGVIDPAAKVIAYYAYPGSNPFAGSGHGTGTMGTIVGDDFANLSTPVAHGHDPADGLAPNARLVAQAPLSGMANSLTDLFSQAYGSGARVHSNSWVSGGNAYSSACVQVDEWVWDRQDFLAVFGAGNSGGAANNRAIMAPALAKNVIAVGGSSHGTVNDGEDLMDYSRGPTFDNRIKPDVVMPGGGVATAQSDDLPGSNNCGRTGGFGGTSAATPAAAGFAVLARQYYADGFYPSGARAAADARVPSAALLKATLLNGAVALRGTDPATGSPVDPVPSFNQGWGRVLLEPVLYFAGDAQRTRVWDKWNEAGLATGASDAYDLALTAGGPLEVTLVWTDPPAAPSAARALVHDLDLEVEAPTGEVYRGNNFLAGESVSGGTADRVNNVEAVRLAAPAAGRWRLRVIGTDVPPSGASGLGDRQGYALVATFPACASSLAAPLDPQATDRGTAGIDLVWSAVPGASGYVVYRSTGTCLGPAGPETVLGEASFPSFSDATAVGGFAYAYRLRATDGCGESDASACVDAVSTGSCALAPRFTGIASATTDGVNCGVHLAWPAGASNCPAGPTLSYNVYRSTVPGFRPAPADRIATGVAGTSYIDPTAQSGVTYYYVVRAEDSTGQGGGPANGGNEESNLAHASATADGPTGATGTWIDDGGDLAARLAVASGWSVCTDDNHTAGGARSYKTGPPGTTYPAGTCAAVVSPDLALDPTGASTLSYWVRYNLEHQWDGVVVEISDDGGGAWADLPPGGGYPGDFSLSDDGNGNPVNQCLYPRAHGAFSGPAGNGGLTAWTEYTSDLSAWQGGTVRLRWRLSSDGGLEYEGLLLDDLAVTGVRLPGACLACVTPPGAGGGLRAVKELPGDLRLHWSDLAGAVGYRATGSLSRDRAGEDQVLEAPGGGAAGVAHGGVLADGRSWYYDLRARGNCGNLGP